MANKIRTTLRRDYLDSNSVIIRSSPSKTTDVSTTSDLVIDNVQVVGTTHEVIEKGDATDDCLAYIENLSSTNTVLVGGDSAGSFVEWFSIPPGYPSAVIPQVGALTSTYIKGSGAGTNVRVVLCKVSA